MFVMHMKSQNILPISGLCDYCSLLNISFMSCLVFMIGIEVLADSNIVVIFFFPFEMMAPFSAEIIEVLLSVLYVQRVKL
jgi:hypothetical protein